jgi:hypothetical protein
LADGYDIATNTFWEAQDTSGTHVLLGATLNVTSVAQSVRVPAQTSVSVVFDRNPRPTPTR